jgi:MBG domain/Right handed beta helix region
MQSITGDIPGHRPARLAPGAAPDERTSGAAAPHELTSGAAAPYELTSGAAAPHGRIRDARHPRLLPDSANAARESIAKDFLMKTLSPCRTAGAVLAVALCLFAGNSQAELFNGAPARTLGPFSAAQASPQPAGGWTAADDRSVGASLHAQEGWSLACSAARYDQEISHALARSGQQSWRVSNWFHEGCVNSVLSPAFAPVQEGVGPGSQVSAEYWFNVPAGNDGLVVSSSLSDAPGARLTYAAIRDSGGTLSVQVVGILQGSGWSNTDPPPFDDAGVHYDIRQSTPLAHEAWYRLQVSAQLVPGARNDLVSYSIFDAAGASVWTSGAMDSWEDAYLAGPFAAPGTTVTLTRLGFRLVENPDDLANRNPQGTYSLNRPAGVFIDDLLVTPDSGGSVSAGFEADRYVANGGSDSGSCANPAAPCASIGYALGQAQAWNTLHIASGTYDESVVVTTPGLRLLGEGPAQPVLTRTSGGTNQALLQVRDVRDVRIENLHFAADKSFVAEGVVAVGDVEGLRVSGNRFVSSQSTAAASTFRFTNAISINHNNNTAGGALRDGRSVIVENNRIEASGASAFRAGIQMDRGLGLLRGNEIVAGTHDLIVRFPSVVAGVSSRSDVRIEGNTLRGRGAQISSPNAGVSAIVFDNNEVRAVADAQAYANAAPSPNPADFSLLRIVHNDAGVPLTVSNNQFLGHAGGYRGVLVQNWPGLLLANNVFTPLAGASDFVSLVLSNKEITTDAPPQTPQPFALTALGNTFNAATAADTGRAVEFINDNDANGAAAYASLVFGGSTLGEENTFAGRHRHYFRLDDHHCDNAGSSSCGLLNYAGVGAIPDTRLRPFAGNISASGNVFDGSFPAAMDAAQRLALQARTYDDAANTALGLVNYGFTASESDTYVDDGYSGQAYGAALAFSHGAVAPGTVYYGINAFASIGEAVMHTASGGAVYVAKGSYGASVIDQHLRLIGDGNGAADTLIAATLTLAASGTPQAPLLVQNLRVSNPAPGHGIVISGSQSDISLDRVSASANALSGLVVQGTPLPTLTRRLRITDSHFDSNGRPELAAPQGYVQAGLMFAENASVDDLYIAGSTFNGNSGAGFSVNNIGAPASTAVIQNVLIENSEFSANAPIGAAPAGAELNYTGGGGVWLKTSGPGSVIRNVEIRTSLFADNGSGRVNPAPVSRRINANGITLRARAGTTLENVRLCDNTFRETAAAGVQEYGIYAYDQTGGWAADAVRLCGTTTFDGLLEGVSGYEQFAANGSQPVILVEGSLNASGGTARAFVSDPVRRYADAGETGTPVLHGSIAAAVAAAAPGNAIVLGQGRYRESVVIPAALEGLVLRGTLQGGSPVSEINGADNAGVQLAGNGISVVGAPHVVIKQLQVTRFDGSCILAMPGATGEPHGLRIGDAGLPDIDALQPYDAANYTTRLSRCGSAAGVGGGVLLDVGTQLDDVRISHVSVQDNQRRGIAVWDARKTNFVLDNNHVANNSLAGMELLDGAASGVVMRNNIVIGNGDAGMGVLGAEGPGVTHIHHNRVQDNGRFGITLNNPAGSGLATPGVAGSGSIVVEDNTVLRTSAPTDTRDLSGIAVIRRARDAAFNVEVPAGVVVRNNTVSGISQPAAGFEGYGIVVEGLQSRVEGNSVSASDIAIQRQAGNTPAPPADGDQAAQNDYFGRGNSQLTCAHIGTNSVDGGSVTGSNGASVRDVDTRPGAVSMAVVVTNADTGRMFCSLQAAIDDASTLDGHVLRISDGVELREQASITKRLRLTRSGTPGTPGAPLLATPASVSGEPALLRVLARDVTIDNLSFAVDLDKLGTAIAALPGGETPAGLVIEANAIQAVDSNLADAPAAPFARRHAISLNGRGYAQLGAVALSGMVVRNNDITGSGSGADLRLFGSGIEFDDSPGTPPVAGPPTLATDGITPVLWLDNNRILAASQDANLRYSNGRVLVSGNTFSGAGLEVGEAQGLFEVAGNQFTPAIPALRSLGIKSVQHGNAYVQVQDNQFSGHAIGVAVQNSQSWHLQDNSFAAPAAGDFVHLWINTKVFGGAPLAFARIEADVRGNIFAGPSGPAARGVAVFFADHDYRAARPAAGIVRLGSGTPGSPEANQFRGAFAHYIYLDPSDCPGSTSNAGCASGGPPAVYAAYGSTVMKPFPADVLAADNGFVASNPGSALLPRDMSAAQIADLQTRTYHDDPLAPEAPPGAPAALGRVEFGFASASVALSVTPLPGNDGRTYALQRYSVRVQNSGGAVPEPVKLRYAISRATSSLPLAVLPMGGNILQDEPAADSVRNEFADPGCLASNGHVENGWCLSRLNPAGGGTALNGEFPQINAGFGVDAGADFSGATRSLFRLPGSFATVLQAVGQNSGTVYASTSFSQAVRQALAPSYAADSAVYADGATLPLAFTVSPAQDITGAALAGKVVLGYSASTGPNDGSSFATGATPPSLAGGYAVTASSNDADYIIDPDNAASYAITRKPVTLSVSGALSAVYSGQPQGLAVTAAQPLSGAPLPGAIAIDYSPAPSPPVNAGSYAWTASVDDPNLSGTLESTAAGAWVIMRAAPAITFGALAQSYNGTPRAATATAACGAAISASAPACDGAPVATLRYGAAGASGSACASGSGTPPAAVGSYEVCATVDSGNYYAQATATLAITGASVLTDIDGPAAGVQTGRSAQYFARLDNTAAAALPGTVRLLVEITRAGGIITAADLFAVQADEGSGGSLVAAENFGTGPNGGLLFKLDGPVPDAGYALGGNAMLARTLQVHFATADLYTLRLVAQSNDGTTVYGADSVVTTVATPVPDSDTQLTLAGPTAGVETGADTLYSARLRNTGTALGENVTLSYCVTRNGLPVQGIDISLGYAASSDGPFTPLALDGSGCVLSGPPGGFALAAGHDETTWFNARFGNGGSYALTATLSGSQSEQFYAGANLLTQVVSAAAGRSVTLAAAAAGLRVGEDVLWFATVRNSAAAIPGLEQQRLCVQTAPGVPATADDISIAYNLDGSADYPYVLSLDAAGCDYADGNNAGDGSFEFGPGYAGEISFRVVFHKAIFYTARLEVRGAGAPQQVYASDTLTRAIDRGQAQIALDNLSQPYTGLHIAPSVTVTPSLPYSLDYSPANAGPTAAGSYAVTATVDTPDWQGSASATLVVSDASGLSLALAGPALAAPGAYVQGYTATLANRGQPTAQPVHTRFTIVRIDDGNADPISASDIDACVQFGDGGAGDCPAGYASLAFGKTTGSHDGRAAVFLRYPNVPANDQPVPTLATALEVPLALRLAPGEYRILAEVLGSGDGQEYARAEVIVSVPAISLSQSGPAVAAAETPLFGATGLRNDGGRLPAAVKIQLRLHEAGNALLHPADAELAWQDGSGYVPLAWTQDGNDLVAGFTPPGGGLLGDGYAATLAQRAVFHRLGQFVLSARAVDAAGSQVYASAAQALEISARGVSITLSDLAQAYDASPRAVAVSTDPAGVAVSLSYSGIAPTVYGPSSGAPASAGNYRVDASAASALYSGSSSATLRIAPANASLSLSGLAQAYNGTPRCATAASNPTGLATQLSYDGGSSCPTAAGSYVVTAAVTDPNYQGGATDILVIAPAAGATITPQDDDGTSDGSVHRSYAGSPVAAVTAVTSPAGLSYSASYQGVAPTVYPATATPPVHAGSYSVTLTTTSPNHVPAQASIALVVDAAASAGISIDGAVAGALARGYNGAPQAVTATTANPAGLGYQLSYEGIAPTVYAASASAPTAAGQYRVTATITAPDYAASPAATATLSITRAAAAISFGSLEFIYDGTPRAASASLAQEPAVVCAIDYNGAAPGNGTPPADAGDYTVSASCEGLNHAGSATATLRIARRPLSITLDIPPPAPYDGNDRPASASVSGDVPADVASVVIRYNGSVTPLPRDAGSYSVQASLAAAETNYSATPASGTLVITKAATTLVLGNLSQTFGNVTPVTATPGTPVSGSITLLYNGAASLPSAVGSYSVSATLDDANYTAAASGTLVIAPATANSVAANGSAATTGIAGAPLAGALPSVRVSDGSNGVAGVTVTFAITAGGGSLSGASVVTDASGIATLGGWLLGANAGMQSVRATAAGIGGNVDFAVNATTQVGLSLSISDGRDHAEAGAVLNYLVVAGNAGPSNAVAASLATSLPAEFVPGSVSWICIASSGSSCGPAGSGTGSLPASLTIAAGGNVSFLLTATVRAQPTELVTFGASLTRPAGAAGSDASASDTTALVLFRDGFDGTAASVAPRGEGVQAGDGLYVAGLRSEAAAELQPRVWLAGSAAAGCRFVAEFLRADGALHARLLAAAPGAPLLAGRWTPWPDDDDLLSLQARPGRLRLAGETTEIVSEWSCGESALTLWPGSLAR